MQAKVDFEIKEKTIEWVFKVEMDIEWFLQIALKVNNAYVGIRPKQIVSKDHKT